MPTPAGLHWGLPAWPTPSPGRARSRWQLQLGSLLTEGIPRGAALDLRPGRMVPEGPPQAQFVQGGLSFALCSAPLRVGRHRAGASAGPLRQLRASWPQWGWDGSHSVWGAPAQLSGGLQESWAGGDEAVWVRQEQSVVRCQQEDGTSSTGEETHGEDTAGSGTRAEASSSQWARGSPALGRALAHRYNQDHLT